MTTSHFSDGPRSLVLLGTGTSLRRAPWTDKAQQMWGPAYLWGRVKRLDIGFQIHDDTIERAKPTWKAVQESRVPVYMQRCHDDVPRSQPYPLEDVRRRFTLPGMVRPFTTNTTSYMLALALLQRPLPEKVSLFGVDLVHGEEYAFEQPSVSFFLGICVGCDIPVYIDPASDLLKTRFLYGFEESARAVQAGELRERELLFRIQRDKELETIHAGLTKVTHLNALITDAMQFLRRTLD